MILFLSLILSSSSLNFLDFVDLDIGYCSVVVEFVRIGLMKKATTGFCKTKVL